MSDKFKFSDLERERIVDELGQLSAAKNGLNLGTKSVLSRIESIIQDRGNSIQDGWIDVEEQKPDEDSYCIASDGDVTFGTVRKYMNGSFWFATGLEHDMTITFTMDESVLFWQPLPSAPKQPKK